MLYQSHTTFVKGTNLTELLTRREFFELASSVAVRTSKQHLASTGAGR